MRILSQDGRIDVPYDTTSLSIWDNHDSEFRKFRIYAHMRNQNGSTCILGIYSTEAKAKKVMEMLHDAYMAHVMYEAMSERESALFISISSEEEQKQLNGVFKFPADDELEG